MATIDLPEPRTRVIVRTAAMPGVRFAWTIAAAGRCLVLSKPETSVRGTAGHRRAPEPATANGTAPATARRPETAPPLPVLPHLGPPQPSTQPPEPGDVLRLSWQSATQFLELPVVVVAREPSDPPNTLRVTTTAAPRSVQRRRNHRIGYHTNVVLEAADGTRYGSTKDLSEGGCLLDLGPRAHPPTQGDVVSLRFAVGSKLIHVHAVIAHTAQSRNDLRRSDVGVRFVDAEGELLIALRSVVLASRVEQQRRSGLTERP